MKKILLEMLICPNCLPDERGLKGDILEERDGDIIKGSLNCDRCGTGYLVKDGIAFLDPGYDMEKIHADSNYETAPALSSYMWSHYGDLLNEENASDAYGRWADLMRRHSGVSVDAGSAVGRFTFEMSEKSDFVVGIDNSVTFIRSARELMENRRMTIALAQEGLLTREMTVVLPESWDSRKVEFIVGDALALPFRSNALSSLASLNLIDKVPFPLMHFQEMNRVVKERDGQFLFSDPFSWSADVAEVKDWLGGKNDGFYSGSGVENVMALLRGETGDLSPAWTIERHGQVWWKIRTHANHFELIRSCFVKAKR